MRPRWFALCSRTARSVLQAVSRLTAVKAGSAAMSNQPQIGIVPIGSLTPYVKSARIHNRHQRRKLRTLLKRFGQVLPIVVDDNGVIVDGHAVWEELKAWATGSPVVWPPIAPWLKSTPYASRSIASRRTQSRITKITHRVRRADRARHRC